MIPTSPDKRRSAYRPDLAAEYLRGTVSAPRFVEGDRRRVTAAHVAMRARPDFDCGLETELLFGESVTVYDETDGWAWVQAERDRYVGYVPAASLGAMATPVTHRVAAVGTFVYAKPDIKSQPLLHLSLNACLIVADADERFSKLATGGFVITRHIAPVDRPALDFVAIAERLEGTPYLWGGRTRLGLDCSGLVQLAMNAADLACPRDADMQRAEIGRDVPVPDALAQPRSEHVDVDGLLRGDLIFWHGHVGIMTDSHMLLHANAHHMSTVVEPVIDAAVRGFRLDARPIAAVRRPGALTASPGSS